MKGSKRIHLASRFTCSRWFIVGVGIAIFLGSAGVYIWWSQSSWDAYEKKYIGIRQEIDTKLTRTFSLQSDTSDERQQKINQLASLAADIEKIDDSFCRQNVLIGWQVAYGEHRTQEDSCKALLGGVRVFNDQLKPTVEYLQQEQFLAKQLSTTPTQAEVSEGDYEGQLVAWREMHEKVKNSSADANFEPVKQVAVDTIGGIVESWGEVIAAHQAKDKPRYLKATQALAAAYDSLQTISSTSSTRLAEVAARLKQAYKL